MRYIYHLIYESTIIPKLELLENGTKCLVELVKHFEKYEDFEQKRSDARIADLFSNHHYSCGRGRGREYPIKKSPLLILRCNFDAKDTIKVINDFADVFGGQLTITEVI